MTNKNYTPQQKAAWAKYESECWSKSTSYIIIIAVFVFALLADSIGNLF